MTTPSPPRAPRHPRPGHRRPGPRRHRAPWHLAIPGDPADGIIQEAAPRAHRRAGLQQVHRQRPVPPWSRPAGWRCRVTEAGGAGEGVSGSARTSTGPGRRSGHCRGCYRCTARSTAARTTPSRPTCSPAVGACGSAHDGRGGGEGERTAPRARKRQARQSRHRAGPTRHCSAVAYQEEREHRLGPGSGIIAAGHDARAPRRSSSL